MVRTSVIGGVAAALVLASQADARINASSAFQVFDISECEECTVDPDSIFCTDGTGFIFNASLPKRYPARDSQGNPIPGEPGVLSPLTAFRLAHSARAPH